MNISFFLQGEQHKPGLQLLSDETMLFHSQHATVLTHLKMLYRNTLWVYCDTKFNY